MKASDHNVMKMNIITNWRTSVEDKAERIEIYNYKNKEDFRIFINETEDNAELRDCFKDENEDLEKSSSRWLSIVNKNIKKCFKRIRINKNKSNSDLEELFEKKEALKIQIAQTDINIGNRDQIREDLDTVEDDIATFCGKRNKEITEQYLGAVRDPLIRLVHGV